MTLIDNVLPFTPVIIFSYAVYRNYSNDGFAKTAIDGFFEWIETGELP